MKTLDMEIALIENFNPRKNIIVTNISWGMRLHECDLLVLTRAGYATEIEIKVSKKDILQDKFKRHAHKHPKISRLYFAIPSMLLEHIKHIPEHAGIIEVKDCEGKLGCRFARYAPQTNKYKFSEKEKLKMAHLGAMRILTLKRAIKRREIQNGSKL